MTQYSSASLIICNCLQNVSNALILSLPFGGLQRRPSLFLPLPVCADSSSHQGVEFILPALESWLICVHFDHLGGSESYA